MTLFALLAGAALAADTTAAKPAQEMTAVFELSVHILKQGDVQKVYESIVRRLSDAGGVQALTGRPDMIAFSFGRGRVPELRKRLEKGLASVASVGLMRGKAEKLAPTFEERRAQAQSEIKLLNAEREKISEALAKAPLIDAYVKEQLRQLGSIDPAKEERQGILLVIVDGADPPGPLK